VAVVGCVLGDQDQLLHAPVAQGARLGDDALGGPADGSSFDGRDGAESARTAAAVGDLEVGAGSLHGNAADSALVRADGARFVGQVVERLRVAARAQPAHQVYDVHPAPRADHPVQPRHLAG